VIVVWQVTGRCNLSCPFCAFDKRLAMPRSDADPAQVREFGEALAAHARETGEDILISWLGGEPLLWGPLVTVSEDFRRRHGFRLSVTTNGIALRHAPIRDHLLDHYTELTFSVDGIGDAHDRLRGWPRGYATLREHVMGMAMDKRRNARGPLLRANVVLMRQTLERFWDLCAELAEWGIEEITFNQLGGRDRPEFFQDNRLLPDQVNSLLGQLPRWKDALAQRGIRLCGGESYAGRLRASALGRQIPVEDCGPGERFLFVDTSGRVAPCSFTAGSLGISMEDIAGPRGVAAMATLFGNARRARRPVACEDCHCTQVFSKFESGGWHAARRTAA
jgi:MoaA/NifB/PqqE/SkfB family radical SAM enzyme